MPGGDRTGPMGMGPMTGRGAGYCGGSPAPGFMNRGFGGGFGGGWFGRGRGGGRGWRNWFHATGMTGWQRAATASPWGGAYAQPFVPTAAAGAQELDAMRGQAEYLAGALEEVKNRIDQLEKQPRPQT